ncbi:MAG: VWA domain-containing protein [Planctomycetes bacterium]|nr:VWA domain-containing protein [Planctomycetota bacterium]
MSGRVPDWLAEWLGVPSGTAADGASWQLDSAWSLAPWATLLLVLAAILFTSLLYARESTSAGRAYRALLTTLRLAAIGLVLIMLAQWAIAVRLTGPPAVALIFDRSTSMSIADRYNDAELPTAIRERLIASGLSEPTRLNLAKLLATENDARLLRTLADRYRLHVYFVAAGIERESVSGDLAPLLLAVRGLSADGPDSSATRLGNAVRHVLDEFRGAPPAAIILLTDGVTTEGLPLAAAAQEARRAGVPLMAVGLGSSREPRDIEVADVLVDDAVFINDLVSPQVQIRATGLDGQHATVALRREGDSTPLATENVTLPPTGQTLTVRLVDRPTRAGDVPYVVEIAPREDETDKKNNRQQRVVAVRDEKIRVLLIQGYPNYEFRFLKSLLERDSTIQLATYLQDADPEYAEQDKTALRSLPVGRDELFEYDVVVIGDVDPRLVPRSVWQNLRAFAAEKGGGVAFIAGPRFLPWLYADISDVGALLPIDLDAVTTASANQLPSEVSQGFVVEPTPLGLQSPALQLGDTPAESQRIWRDLAPLYWLYESGDLKPAAQVLAKSAIRNPQSAIPVICFQYVGAGQVLFHAIDSTWRWRIGAGDIYFARYWVQTIRFLARGKLTSGRDAQLTSDRREYSFGETIELRARFLDARLAPAGDEVTVVVESPGQARRRVTLRRNPAAEGVFTGILSDLAQGQYDVVLAEPQVSSNPPAARFTVEAPPGELARPIMDAAALTAAAQITRGKFYNIAGADQLLSHLPTGRRVPIENLPPISIWNCWWLLAAFLGCITTEWILRKRKGML